MVNGQLILLLEDDVVGVMTVKRAFKHHGVRNPLHVVPNGREALAYLRACEASGEYAARPGLILLDINMPLMNGIEFLSCVRRDPAYAGFRMVPVVALTTSSNERDVAACFALGVAGYLVKPVRYSDFVEQARVLKEYWSQSATPRSDVLPRRADSSTHRHV